MSTVTNTPVTKPLTVLPELIFGINLIPPMIFPPIYENVSKSQIMAIVTSRKYNETFSVISKNKNKKKDNTAIVKYRLKIKCLLILFFI